MEHQLTDLSQSVKKMITSHQSTTAPPTQHITKQEEKDNTGNELIKS